MSRSQKIYSAAFALAVVMSSSPAWAPEVIVSVPEPGVLGLVAMGVVGALLVGRKRK